MHVDDNDIDDDASASKASDGHHSATHYPDVELQHGRVIRQHQTSFPSGQSRRVL